MLIALVFVLAACSGSAADTTTTLDELSEITYQSAGLPVGVFNGVSCELDDEFRGTITGVDESGGTIAITLTETGGNIVIDHAELQADAPVTSVEDLEEFALQIMAASVPVDVAVVYSEWPACSA